MKQVHLIFKCYFKDLTSTDYNNHIESASLITSFIIYLKYSSKWHQQVNMKKELDVFASYYHEILSKSKKVVF